MAVVFQSDPTLSGFNAYCTVAEADDYQTTKLNSAWAALTSGVKQNLIIWATREMSTLDWVGSKTDIAQPQEWPRKYVYIKGGTANSEVYDSYQFPWDSIPQFLKDATADLAGVLAEGDTTAPTGTEGFKSIKIDTIEMVMDARDRLSWLPDSSRNLCARYLLNQSKYSVETVRV